MVMGGGIRPAGPLRYNPVLDGLRALAIVAVIGDHAGLRTHGFHGVTLFFVISGYLITALLVGEQDRSGTVSLRGFYWRRLVRLGPALVTAVLATLAFLLLTGRPLATFWLGLVGALTYSMDLVQTFLGDDRVGIHFQWSWSLGVEEQFYLLWPVALLLLLRRNPRALVPVLAVVVGAAWVCRAMESSLGASHDMVFFGPLSHFDALALGALVALLRSRWEPGPLARSVLGAAALVGGAGLVLLELRVPTGLQAIDPNGFGEAAIFSTAVVLWGSSAERGPVGGLLAIRPVAYLGRLSYTLYLWNVLTIVAFIGIAGRHPAQSPLGPVWAVALLVVAAVSHHCIETPLRRRWAAARPFRPAAVRAAPSRPPGSCPGPSPTTALTATTRSEHTGGSAR